MHSRPEFIGTLVEGIACFTPAGRFLAASRSALFQLGLPKTALQTHTFSSLFGLPVSTSFDHYRTAAPGLLNLCLHSGVRVYARAELRLSKSVFQHVSDSSDDASETHALPTPGDKAPRRLSSLRYLNTGDPHMAALISKLDKVIGRDIPILITGETGTGKELLAQALLMNTAATSCKLRRRVIAPGAQLSLYSKLLDCIICDAVAAGFGQCEKDIAQRHEADEDAENQQVVIDHGGHADAGTEQREGWKPWVERGAEGAHHVGFGATQFEQAEHADDVHRNDAEL